MQNWSYFQNNQAQRHTPDSPVNSYQQKQNITATAMSDKF
jgi:hypothetical protein